MYCNTRVQKTHKEFIFLNVAVIHFIPQTKTILPFKVVHKSQTTEVGFIAKFVKEFDNVYIRKKCRFRNVLSLNLILMAHKMYIFCSEQNKLGYTATRITFV